MPPLRFLQPLSSGGLLSPRHILSRACSPLARRSLVSASDLTFGQPLPDTHPHLLKAGELTPGITALEYAERRLRLAHALPPNSLAIVPANELKYRVGPVFYPYHQDPDFFYLTGFCEPEALAIIEKKGWGGEHNFHLYCRPKDEYDEAWNGSRSGNQAALDVFNADESGDVYDLTSQLSKMLAGAAEVYTDISTQPKKRSPFSELIFGSAAANLVRLSEQLSASNVKPLRPLMNELRVVKSAAEVANLRKAGQASARAFTDAMRQEWRTEYELENFLEYKFRANGCHTSAYVPVVAGGIRANQIHYTRNDDVFHPDELIVVDAGGEYGDYITDITRSWPANGKFSPAQKDMYEMILAVQRSCISMCRADANISLDRIHHIAATRLMDGLKQLGFDTSLAGAHQLFPHHLGHYIGLSVHDAPGYSRSGSLKANQCITIEPGIYVDDDARWPKHFRGMGIRIEDSICVQEEHPLNLTSEAVKEVVDIEALRRIASEKVACSNASAGYIHTHPDLKSSGSEAQIRMAATAILSPSADSPFMASRQRLPLSNAPNLANSPYRATNGKRLRSQAVDERENADAYPPKKRLAVESGVKSLRRHDLAAVDDAAGNVFTGKPERHIPNSFNRRLNSVREAGKTQAAAAGDKTTDKHLQSEEQLRVWRRHYRKIFPSFVFFFESLPQDVSVRAARQIARLGAKEEKFFSKAVTHIVTLRDIPPDPAKGDDHKSTASRTINPSLLDKSQDSQSNTQRPRSILDVVSQRRDQKSGDILLKARAMGVKIWALEKFDRMMTTLLDMDVGQDETTRNRPPRASKETDLRVLVRNERNGHTQTQQWQDIVPFKGYFIYIHDMDERVKPCMLRDYPKPATGKDSDGDWPKFHSVSTGRCPFVEEPYYESRDQRARREGRERQRVLRAELRAREARQRETTQDVELSISQRTRSATRSPCKAPLQDATDAVNQMPKPPMPPTAKTFEPPKLRNENSGNLDSMPPMLGSARANFQGITRNPGGEPLASGMQGRNVTSAIRSQAVSSTAGAPGAGRAGISKDMHYLARRTMEKQSALSNNSMPSSYMNDVRAAINNATDPNNRRTTRQQRGAKALFAINENEEADCEEQPKVQLQKAKLVTKTVQKAAPKRDPKPGYCENCRDKYDDFYEHIESKMHQKFALADDNFLELDELLQQLARA